MNLDKLKETARRYELREEWRRAIDTYHRVAQQLSEAGGPVDPALFNRIGDLELKVGSSADALTAYQRAQELYTEQGFFNNAIALCGKILRVDPGQIAIYLRLAELHARKNVIPEAKRNLVQYVERLRAAGRLDQAVETLKSFAARFGGSPELLLAIGDLLKAAGGSEEVDATVDRLGAEGEGVPEQRVHPRREGPETVAPPPVRGLVFIDTGIDIPGVAGLSRGASFDSVAEATAREETAGEAVRGFEPTVLAESAIEMEGIAPLVSPSSVEPVEVPGLEPTAEFGFELSVEPPESLLTPLFIDPPPPEALSLDEESPPKVEPGIPESVTGEDDLFDNLDVEDAPEPEVGTGSRTASIPDLERLLAAREATQDWVGALHLSSDLLQADPDNLARYQKRVELAYRAGDRQLLVSAYLSLGDVLMRQGAAENALLVYNRVLDHDPGNPVALAALAALRPVDRSLSPPEDTGPAPDPARDFVDLGALIMDPEPERDTRMRVEPSEPVGDEDRDFQETLSQFKEGIEANLDASDFQAHYDLGIAFKEMGLLDEAIAQFQRSLRAPEGRLKSAEALGIAFYDKGRYSIAEAVLGRAVETLAGADDEKIALFYWLGRAHEAQGRASEAIRWYERAMAVDITFLDLGERVRQFGAGDRS